MKIKAEIKSTERRCEIQKESMMELILTIIHLIKILLPCVNTGQ